MSWWQELVDLVLPADCAGCGTPRTALCSVCEQELSGGGPVRRVFPDQVPPGLPPVYAAATYADAVRATLLAHKERGALRLAVPLGAALAAAVSSALDTCAASPCASGRGVGWALVPVPSSGRAVAARGHDPTLRLARAAARQLRRAGVPVQTLAALRQTRPVADQAGLGAAERSRNLQGALAVHRSALELLRGQAVVVVDDLLTTGASLSEGARAVERAGARVVGAGVVAVSVGTRRSIGR